MVKLHTLKKNDKFKWNGFTYTVYDQAPLSMVEVFGNGKWWAYPWNMNVEKLEWK